jgi:hypothetical protein
MTEELMADRSLEQKTSFFSKEKRIAGIRCYQGSLNRESRDLSSILNTGLVTIAGGMISQLRILDVTMNNVLGDLLRQPYIKRLLPRRCTQTPAENC